MALSQCLTLVTFNLIFMIICIVLGKQTGYKYTGMIQDETSEWNQGAIVDIKAINASLRNVSANICGDGYEIQTSTFLGTKDYCSKFYSYKGRSRCSYEKGAPQKNMNIHKNNVICIKKNPDLSYHVLLENFRNGSCATGNQCGSSNDS